LFLLLEIRKKQFSSGRTDSCEYGVQSGAQKSQWRSKAQSEGNAENTEV
jgi:hypothetical protein